MHDETDVSVATRSAVVRKLVATLAAVGLILLIAACGGGSVASGPSRTDAGSPQRGGTLDLAVAGEPLTLDPVGDTNTVEKQTQMLVFDQLLEFRAGSSKLVPGLAKSWQFGPGRRSLVFQLRDARFSDGTPMTSADVKFSFERAMNPKTDVLFGASLAQLIQSISTPDAHTVILHFAGPRPAIFSYLTFAPLSVLSKRAFERLGAQRFGAEALDAGTGPFKIVKWVKGQRVELARNPYYWRKGLPYLDRVNLLNVPDDNTRMLDLRSGQVDVADNIPYSQLTAMRAAPGVTLQVAPIAAIDTVFFSAKGPLKSVAVRQALNYATPKSAIRKVVFQNEGAIANTFIAPMIYGDSGIKPYPFDIAKAKQLMASSSTPHGFDAAMLVQSGDAVSRETAAILQNAWAQIGVRLHVETLDAGTLQAREGSGNFQLFLPPPDAATSDIPSEDEYAINFAQPAFEQIFSFADPKLQTLIASIEGTWDESKRHALFAVYQREQLANPIGIPIVAATARRALRDSVEGFEATYTNWLNLDQTWLKR
jgi:peptide/nickel transport system substrate-binding protein